MLIIIDGVCYCDQCGRDHIVVPTPNGIPTWFEASKGAKAGSSFGHVCDSSDVRAHEAEMEFVRRECERQEEETPLPACKCCGVRDDSVAPDGLGMLICSSCDSAALDAANRYEERLVRQEQEEQEEPADLRGGAAAMQMAENMMR